MTDDRARGGRPAEPARTSPLMPDGAVLRRTADGWSVAGEDMPDLTCAMVLADLIAAELSEDDDDTADGTVAPRPKEAGGKTGGGKTGGGKTGGGKARHHGDAASADDETSRLRATVGQLERALSVRVRVEQAIGILAERHRVRPRQAFEQLRSVARGRGQRVVDIAGDVIASATNPLLQLPDELSRPSASQRSRGQRRVRDSS
jgi:ANTAR domain